jgi:hypothetical protein
MKNTLTTIKIFSLFILLTIFFVGNSRAQPSAAQVKKIFTNPKIVSLEHKPGSRVWSSGYKKYVWDVPYKVKIKGDEPGIFLIVRGIASFDIVGGRYIHWRNFVTENSYEGIPNPTKEDVQGLIQKFGLEKVLGNYHFNQLIGKVESIGLSTEPNYEWHTMNSVSFNILAVYTRKGVGYTAPNEYGSHLFRVRLYRDNPKSEWTGIISSSKEWKKL